jgi:AcrR family transcriptional regulator
MSRIDTKTRILDAAERLFARDGFHNSSLRTLTGLAGVNLAAVNYHFGSKEALLKAVFARRLTPLNQIRQEKIEAVLAGAEQAGKPPTSMELLRAFIEPTLEFRHSGAGAQDFIALIGRAMSEPDETLRNCFMELVLPLFQLFAASLARAIPHLPREILLARLLFAIGSMSHVMFLSNRNQPNPVGIPPLPEDRILVPQLLKFLQAGLEAPL